RLVVERTRIDRLHVRQNVRLPRRLVDLQAQQLLLPADLERARRPRAECSHQELVEILDAPAEVGDEVFRALRLYSPLFSHATYFSTRPARSGSPACDAISWTSALPTTAASALL